MKRYLISGTMALIAGLFVTSCHDKGDSSYTPENVQKTMQFEAAFKETFTSKIDPNQDWGFTPAYLTMASTRVADPRSNMWASEGYTIPTAITPTEKQLVVNYFSNKGAESYTSLIDWSEFFVQQVYKGTAQYTAGNGGEVTGGNQMDWLCAGSASMGDDHVNNFNNADGSVMLMVNSSTQRFGFKSSSDNGHVFHNFRMVDGATIDPSLAGFYYVGFDFEAAGQNPNEQISRDLIYNDWIVKILPSKGVTNNNQPSTAYTKNTRTTKTEYFKKRYLMDYGRVFCEDLGGNYSLREDFDYNDVVFDAKLWKEVEWQKVTVTTTQVITTTTTYYEKDAQGNVVMENGQPKVSYVDTTTKTETTEETPVVSMVEGTSPTFYAEICLLATGATLPVRVGGQDAIEVHKAFGDFSVDCMINTFDEYTATVKNGFGYHETAEPITLDWIDVTSYYADKTQYSVSDIPVYVRWQGTEATAVKATKGTAPERFTIREKINWASERANLNVGYPNFTSWVESSSPFWSGVSANATGLYQGYPSPTAGLTFDSSDVGAEHILAVHYTKYDIEEIEGETVEVDGGGNTNSGDNNGNGGNNGNNGNNGNGGNNGNNGNNGNGGNNGNNGNNGNGGNNGNNGNDGSANSVTLVTASNPVSSGNIVTDRATVEDYYSKMSQGRSKITVTIKPTKDNWNYLTFSYGGQQGDIFSVHGPYGQAGEDYSQYKANQQFTVTWVIDVNTLYEKLLSNPYYFPGGLFHVQGADAQVVGLTLEF